MLVRTCFRGLDLWLLKCVVQLSKCKDHGGCVCICASVYYVFGLFTIIYAM